MSTSIAVIRKIGDSIQFDATILERHGSDLTITDNPVETGELISDHAYAEPKNLEVMGVVSHITANSNDDNSRFGGSQRVRANYDTSKPTRTYDELLRLQESRVPFSVQTGLKLYRNMLIKSLSIMHEQNNNTAPEFNCIFREVKIVTTSTAKLDRSAFKTTKRTTNASSKSNSVGTADQQTKKRADLEQKTADRAEETTRRGDIGETKTETKKQQSLLFGIVN